MMKNAVILASIVVTMSMMPVVLLHNVTASGLAEPVTRVVQRTVEGETENVTETLYHSPFEFSFWYDEETFLIERADAEYGSGVSVSPVTTDYPVYMEIYPPETVGVLPWKYLELNAREGDEYNYETLESGARIIWFERDEDGFLYGYYAIETDQTFAVAYLECAEEVVEGYGARLKNILWTLSFDGETAVDAAGNEKNASSSGTGSVTIRWAYGQKANVLLGGSSGWTLPGEENPLVEITAEKTITDFRILSLDFEEMGADGTPKFEEETAYELPVLEAGKSIRAEMEFLGSIPNYGISFVDENGAVQRYLIEESGRDGSLLLGEW